MPANKPRGEVALTIAGTDLVLRPTFQAQCRIEDATGKSMIALLRAVIAKDIRTFDLAAIVAEGAHASDADAPDFDEIGDLLAEHGIDTAVLVPVSEFITNAVGGTRNAKPARGGARPTAPAPGKKRKTPTGAG